MEDIEEELEQEFKLAQQMKDAYCDESGKETNPAKAAEIIHKIGKIYRKRSPDKISLIKSAGLFNAAISRNPSNIAQIKSDLSEICQHILQQAEAKEQSADLVKKAEQVRYSADKLRKEVNEHLRKSVPKISQIDTRENFQKQMSSKLSEIKQINKRIAAKYCQIMTDLSQFCENVMGKPPCEYAIVGMGSLAREEITPYSDFEHVILLFDDKNYKSYLNYFRWFSVIFHIIVLNVQETILPSLYITSLNNKHARLGNWYYDAITPRGISFDGMMPHASKFPLGRLQQTEKKQFTTELIKPVSEMLEYLSSEADLKNGYHLADILTKTCFVFGNEDIFKQFTSGVQKYRNQKSPTDIIDDVEQQVKDDLNSFSTRFRLTKLNLQSAINIKQLVYRSTTIFISALARLYNISANSCFDAIEEMAESNKMTQHTAHKLQCAIAIACEMRLRVYMEKKSQCDNAVDLKHESIEKFLDIVGVASTISYFQIAYCLQCEIAKQLNFTKLHFYSDPRLINITIGLAFGVKDLAIFSENLQKQFWDSSEFDFDKCIDQVERVINTKSSIFNRNTSQASNDFDLNVQKIQFIADFLLTAEIHDEALDFFHHLLDIHQSESVDNDRDYEVAMANKCIGFCLNELSQPSEALIYLNRALILLIKINKPSNADKNRQMATTLHCIGRCHIVLQNYDDALKHLNRALEIDQKTMLNVGEDNHIATTLHEIGRCHLNLQNYDDALKYLNRALAINQNTTPTAEKSRDIAFTLQCIGSCHLDMHNFNSALSFLNQALDIYQTTSLNAEKDWDIATTVHELGRCHIDMQNYKDALTYLNRALTIDQSTALKMDEDRNIAITQSNIGRCLTGLRQFDESWKRLEESLKILRSTTSDEEKDIRIANTLSYMGECLIGKQKFAEAISILQQSLKIFQTSNIRKEKDTRYAEALYNIGFSLSELQDYANALNYFKESLEIYKNIKPNEHTTSQITLVR